MGLFKNKSKMLPTYYEPFAKNIKQTSSGFIFQLVAKDNSDAFEIWYYGNLMGKSLIVGTGDCPSKVVARVFSTGEEIIIYDGLTHGYDNMTWQEHKDAIKIDRPLKRLDFGKITIETESLSDDEGDWELDENGCVTSDHNKKFKWSDFKRDAITGLVVNLVTEKGKKEIVNEELA